MSHQPPATASRQRRRTKVAANVRAYYSRADYVTPRVALDAAHTKALRAYMKRAGLGVSDAIRAAILAVAATGEHPRGSNRRLSKNHSAGRS